MAFKLNKMIGVSIRPSVGVALGALGLAAAGCVSTSRVFEVAPGVYSVTTTGDGFTTADRTRTHVLASATDYCGKMAKHLLVVNEAKSDTRMGIDTTIDVRFQCIDAPAAAR